MFMNPQELINRLIDFFITVSMYQQDKPADIKLWKLYQGLCQENSQKFQNLSTGSSELNTLALVKELSFS